MNTGAGQVARRYLRHHRDGVLSTLSRKFDGYPFGSIVPFVLDHAARPVILISRLAEHTQNIAGDPRVSLFVRDAGTDPQKTARLTLLGDALPAGDDTSELQIRYLRYFPDAARLMALRDFEFFRLAPVALRYIQGFGDMDWITADSYAPPANAIAGCEADIVAHMNADHAAALGNCWAYYKQREGETVAMAGIDCEGFDLRSGRDFLRVDFDRPVADAHMVRAALATLAPRA